MKKTLALVVSVSIFLGALYYYKIEENDQSVDGSMSDQIPNNDDYPQKPEVPSPQKSIPNAKSEPTKDVEREREKARSDWSPKFGQYRVPSEDLSSEVSNIIESIQTDPSGRSEFKLFRIAEFCARAPKSEDELQEIKSLYEDASLMSGQGNGEIIENIARADMHYKECKELQKKNLLEPYYYLDAAAAKGDPGAKIVLATLYKPKDFSSWHPDSREKYRNKMESALKDARADCEPMAFYAIAQGVSENDLWVDSSKIPKDIRKYSNLLAQGMIHANKIQNSDQDLIATRAKLKSLALAMNESDIEEAEMYGRYLYQESCE